MPLEATDAHPSARIVVRAAGEGGFSNHTTRNVLNITKSKADIAAYTLTIDKSCLICTIFLALLSGALKWESNGASPTISLPLVESNNTAHATWVSNTDLSKSVRFIKVQLCNFNVVSRNLIIIAKSLKSAEISI